MLVSVILPVYNEAPLLPTLWERLSAVLGSLPHAYELLFVNDGSQDDSLAVLRELHQRDPRVKVVSLTRNFGQQTALSAGLRYAQGDAVILMDTDLQDPPEVIPQLLAKWQEGWEVVYGVRTKRQESAPKRLAYRLFYRLLAAMTRPSIPQDAGDFSILSRRVVDLLNQMPERTRFLRGLRSWVGVKQTPLEYERDRRYGGRPKYTWGRLIRLGLDGVVAFSHAPLRLASMLGLACACAAFVSILIFLYFRLFTDRFITGYTSIIIAILFLGSVQLFAIGILGEYVARIYDEVKQRPLYVVDECLGLPAAPASGVPGAAQAGLSAAPAPAEPPAWGAVPP